MEKKVIATIEVTREWDELAINFNSSDLKYKDIFIILAELLPSLIRNLSKSIASSSLIIESMLTMAVWNLVADSEKVSTESKVVKGK